MKAAQHFYREGDRLRRQESVLKNGFAQTCDFAVFVNFEQAMCNQPGDFQPDRVRSDVNGGKGRHSATVYRYRMIGSSGDRERFLNTRHSITASGPESSAFQAATL
jgi:hypothetical protein